VKRLNAVVLDLDAGQPKASLPGASENGLAFLYYSSHSHAKIRTKIELKSLKTM